MKMPSIVAAAAFVFVSATNAQNAVPPGSILAVALNSTISTTSKAGEIISARVMQDVTLAGGQKIRAGAKLTGHVIAVVPSQGGSGAEVSLVFDRLESRKRSVPVTTSLRAMASFMDVEAAQVPAMGPDRGTPQDSWTTELIGGDVDYRGGRVVREGAERVGRPVPGGVLSQVSANPAGQCRGIVEGNDEPQPLWVFSSNACGLYDFPGVTLTHAGRDNPIGQIILRSSGRKLTMPAGTGMLLRVIGSREELP